MTTQGTGKFNPELWAIEGLQLTDDQAFYLPQLQIILEHIDLPIAETLRSCAKQSWTQRDMKGLQQDIIKLVGKTFSGKKRTSARKKKDELVQIKQLEQEQKKEQLRDALNILLKIVARHQRLTDGHSPFPQSVHKFQLETNPFGPKLADHDRLVTLITDFVLRAARQPNLSDESVKKRPEQLRKLAALAVISSIVHFHLLHKSMLIALIEALANREQFLIWPDHPKKHYIWSLSLAYQGEEESERRMFIPDQLTGTLLSRLSEADIQRVFTKGLNNEQKLGKRHDALWRELEHATRDLLAEDDLVGGSVGTLGPVTLKSILAAAVTVAYIHLPPAIAAARCRKTVTHAPRKDVMLRIFKGTRVDSHFSVPRAARLTPTEQKAVEADADKETADKTQVEPQWMQELRKAFGAGASKQVQSALVSLVERAEQPGPRIADFACHLLGSLKVRTVERYSLLIARRIGCRLGVSDPLSLPINTLEDHYRAALYEEWDDDRSEDTELEFRRNKRAAITAIIHFHQYLVLNEGPPLEELAAVLKTRGLLPVDANFITMDEYEDVLTYLAGPGGPDERYLNLVLRVIVILAFRCGLRRSEVLGLLSEDLDAADHLQVRSNYYRDVKTLNSTRSIPAGIFLSATELILVQQFFQERQVATKSGTYALLFSLEGDASVPLNADMLVNYIHSAMRECLDDASLKMHHFRHSFATLVAAKLLPNTTTFVREYLYRHPKTLQWLEQRDQFRTALFGSLAVTGMDLQAVAHLLGHGSADVSVEHYIHCLDWYARQAAPNDTP